MYVKKLSLYNFRNYNLETVYFCKGLNLICGKNAQGKTNLLEAVYLSSIGRSPRTKRDKDLINFKSEKSQTALLFHTKKGDREIKFILSRSENKKISLNGASLTKISELMGELKTVYFSPDELKLVKDAPADRRKFLDISLCQQFPSYFKLLSQYNTVLANRNKLIKNDSNHKFLSILDVQLAKLAAQIILYRKQALNKITPYAKNIHSLLSLNTEDLNLTYQTLTDKNNPEEITADIINAFNASKNKDAKLGYTSVGPHRDDIKITVNGLDVRNFGSQGQQRTVALSLKLAETEVFRENNGEYPVLLLDDVLSELDLTRQKILFEVIRNLQTIITATHIETMPQYAFDTITIENGKILR